MNAKLICLMMGLCGLLGACASNAPQKPWWSNANVSAPPAKHSDGAIYSSSNAQPMFGDVRAHQVGDVLTVIVNEQASASKQANTQINRQGTVNNSASALFGSTNPGRYNLKAGSNNKFNGSGQSAQKNSFTTTLTAVVTHVLPNGNLVIQGSKQLLLDQGKEFIRLRGVVRPASIQPNNTVLSQDVADANIQYTGAGVFQSAQHVGWLQRFLMAIWPF